jgi:hypothetical protein
MKPSPYRHYLVATVGNERRDRRAACQTIADALATACRGVPEVESCTVERNRVSGPGQVDVIFVTTYADANALVLVRGTVLRECIEKLREEFPDLEVGELSAMS